MNKWQRKLKFSKSEPLVNIDIHPNKIYPKKDKEYKHIMAIDPCIEDIFKKEIKQILDE